jgi:uncharacterized protein
LKKRRKGGEIHRLASSPDVVAVGVWFDPCVFYMAWRYFGVVCCWGVIIYWFKSAETVWLWIAGIFLFVMMAALNSSVGFVWDFLPAESQIEMKELYEPSQSTIDEEVSAYTGSISETHAKRVREVSEMHSLMLLYIWRVVANMLFGMALFKMGILKGMKSKAFYRKFMLMGFGIGFPLIIIGVTQNFAHNWDLIYFFSYGFQFNYFGSIFVAFGYIGLIALWSKSDFLTDLKRRLAAVGRMAFTNYIMQSIICTIIFYGFGFGLFNQIERFPQQLIVLAIWIFQLAISPWWLKRYRFGPLEWLWRTLTYWKRQPLRRF